MRAARGIFGDTRKGRARVMSFIRPEIAAALRRNAGLLVPAIMLFAAIMLLRAGWRSASAVLLVTGLCACALAGAVFWSLLQRQRFHRDTAAPGVVEIDEARITYLAPEAGRIVDRDALTRVTLSIARDGMADWVLARLEAEACAAGRRGGRRADRPDRGPSRGSPGPGACRARSWGGRGDRRLGTAPLTPFRRGSCAVRNERLVLQLRFPGQAILHHVLSLMCPRLRGGRCMARRLPPALRHL